VASEPTGAGLALAAADEIGLERLQRRPIIDRIDQRQLALIKRTIAVAEGDQAITDAELGHFLELCAVYGLDPFAREAWIAKSKTGKLLIMVGRDGLRKIVERNGLKMRGGVIYAKDHFEVEHIDSPADATPGEWEAHGSQPFHRVTHRQVGIGAQRGPVVGAWARVKDRRTGAERGYFDAPLSEYLPANVSQYSPWSKQVSTMMLGAVERQAARQATPLGGLLHEGEDESADARQVGRGEGDGESPGWHCSVEHAVRAERVVLRARELGIAGLSNDGALAMQINGLPADAVERVLAGWEATVQRAEQEADIPEAEVVTSAPADEDPEARAERALRAGGSCPVAAERGGRAGGRWPRRGCRSAPRSRRSDCTGRPSGCALARARWGCSRYERSQAMRVLLR
jgi:hypothetical protein